MHSSSKLLQYESFHVDEDQQEQQPNHLKHTHARTPTHSLGIGSGELTGLGSEGLVVAGELLGDGGLEGVVSVGALEQGDQRLDHELGVERRDPGVLDGLGADLARVLLYIRVIDLGLEEHLRRLEGVVVAEVNVNNELAALIRGVLGSKNSCVPVGQVVTYECNANTFYCLRHVQVI